MNLDEKLEKIETWNAKLINLLTKFNADFEELNKQMEEDLSDEV